LETHQSQSDGRSPIAALRAAYRNHTADPATILTAALAHSNSNASHNVYLAQDTAFSHSELAHLRLEDIPHQPLWGVPVSLKDCFDLAGFPTTCGSTFYKQQNGIATTDSTIAARLRAVGAVITGKTHLHQVAYGITGENPEFGDCLQPRDATRLTGGSSSGAAASVQEGSALAALGTDTGGSIRVPAAMCGLSGYRSSITLSHANDADLWHGGHHLAPSFDTIGWLYRDLRDGPLLANALFALPIADAPNISTLRIGVPSHDWLSDCEPAVLNSLHTRVAQLQGLGANVTVFDAPFFKDATAIFSHIQSAEAAFLHRGNFHHLEFNIVERLTGGAIITGREFDALLFLQKTFIKQMAALFRSFDYLLLPCAPMAAIPAGQNHDRQNIRRYVLRYTAPASLAGLPVIALPADHGGIQLIGPQDSDARLLALSAALA
jgi:aspartyl-tRNA(Asn)/glutamyl-tRNA(Gln) amidotransferase subunit A